MQIHQLAAVAAVADVAGTAGTGGEVSAAVLAAVGNAQLVARRWRRRQAVGIGFVGSRSETAVAWRRRKHKDGKRGSACSSGQPQASLRLTGADWVLVSEVAALVPALSAWMADWRQRGAGRPVAGVLVRQSRLALDKDRQTPWICWPQLATSRIAKCDKLGMRLHEMAQI